MKDSGAFFFLGDSLRFQKSKVYHCIYAKTSFIQKRVPTVEKGKVFFAYFDDIRDYPVGVISYKEYNEYVKEMKEQYSILDYTPEQLNAIMEKKGIFKKGMRKYSTKWFQKMFIFILHQLELMR